MSLQRLRARRQEGERGAALLELAIALPIFFFLAALIIDAGFGFGAARHVSTASRAAARAAAHAGDDRMADYRGLDAVRAEFAGNRNDTIVQVTIYRSAAGGDGLVPLGCGLGGGSINGLCNVYPGAILDSLIPAQFDDDDCGQTGPGPGPNLDAAWCPTDREADDGDYLGVSIWTQHEAAVGLTSFKDAALEDRSVFALFFPEPPAPLAP